MTKKIFLVWTLTLGVVVSLLMASFVSTSAQAISGSTNSTQRIMGGTAASQASTKWFVQVSIIFPWAGSFKTGRTCGGSVISQRWILTAAHCVTNLKTGVITPLVSESYAMVNPSANKVNLPVMLDTIVRHPGYNYQNQNNDIALLHTKTSLYTSTLPYSSEVTQAGAQYTHFGYGDVDASGTTSSFLKQQAMTDTAGYAGQCYTFDPEHPFGSNICATASVSNSTCGGDSGSPLTLKSPTRVVGIDSLGSCVGGSTTVFTRVSFFAPWIKQVTGVNANTPTSRQTAPKPVLQFSLSCGNNCNNLRNKKVITVILKNISSKSVKWKIDNFETIMSKDHGTLSKKTSIKITMKVATKDVMCSPSIIYSNNVAISGFLFALNKPSC